MHILQNKVIMDSQKISPHIIHLLRYARVERMLIKFPAAEILYNYYSDVHILAELEYAQNDFPYIQSSLHKM